MELEPSGAEALVGGEAIAEAATVETPESTPEQPATENAAEQPEADGNDEAAAPRKKPGVHNRIDELTRQKHDALRDAAYWREQAEKLARTDTDALEYDDQLVVKVRKAGAEERVEAAERVAQGAIAEQFRTLEDQARAKWADYDQVTRDPSLSVTQEMAELISESEIGPDLAYHLGKNAGEARKLAGLSGRELAREVGRLEARLSAPKVAPKQPPAPVSPVGGSASGGSADPSKMSMAEYVAARNAGKL